MIRQSEQRIICPYCSEDFRDTSWTSRFWAELHYKVFNCKCGKDISVRVKFNGSGHDSWDHSWVIKEKKVKGEKITTLEQKIEIVKESIPH